MKAIVYEGPGKVALLDVAKPTAQEGTVLIKISCAGVCGSDMTIFSGKHPRAKAPLVLGHEFSGRIASPHPTLAQGTLVSVYPHIACGHCRTCEEGLPYTCGALRIIGIDRDGGMAEYAQVPVEAVYPLQEGTPEEVAAFVEPISVAVHAVRHGHYRGGDSVVVFGAGGIGLSTAITLRHFGADKIWLCEPNEARRKTAQALGFEVIDPANTLQGILAATNGLGADFVFDCAGHQSVIDILPDAVRIGGTIVMVAGYKTPPTMNFQKGMFREFDIRFVRNSSKKDFEIACALATKNLGYDKLLNCILAPEQVQEGFAVPQGALKVMFHFNA